MSPGASLLDPWVGMLPNKALQQTGGAWLRALGGPVVRAASLRRRPQLNAVLGALTHDR
jgi:hypothetical protein